MWIERNIVRQNTIEVINSSSILISILFLIELINFSLILSKNILIIVEVDNTYTQQQ